MPSGTFTFKGSHRVETVSSLTNTRDGLALVHICTRKEDNHFQLLLRISCNQQAEEEKEQEGQSGMSPAGCNRSQLEPKDTSSTRREGHQKWLLWTKNQFRVKTFPSTFAVTFDVLQKNMLKDPGNPGTVPQCFSSGLDLPPLQRS